MKTPSPKFIDGFKKAAMQDVKDMQQRAAFSMNAKHPNFSKKGVLAMLKRRGVK